MRHKFTAMAQAKTELFDKNLASDAALFKALAHPARLAILQYLARIKICITGDISDELPLSRTTINQHLKELKKAGLIQGRIDGVKVNYCLDPKRICELGEVFRNYFSTINNYKETGCK